MTEQNQNSQFSSQLLHMTITFVNEQMKEEAAKKVPGGGPSLDELTGYMLQLRECLADTPKHTLDLNQWPGSNAEDQFGLSRKNSEMWSNLNREVCCVTYVVATSLMRPPVIVPISIGMH